MSSRVARSERVNGSVGWAARKSRTATARVAARAGRAIRCAQEYERVFDIAKVIERGGSVKLDLLYEFQPKIKPWAKPHPYGQRDAEQRTYDEAVAEIQYADKLGFNTVWVVEHHFRDGRSASPCNEAILGGLA